jgi:hypothetical protein
MVGQKENKNTPKVLWASIKKNQVSLVENRFSSIPCCFFIRGRAPYEPHIRGRAPYEPHWEYWGGGVLIQILLRHFHNTFLESISSQKIKLVKRHFHITLLN